jgi:Survival motor neuron (SMN) interacting protein 1 (SIP1)
MPKRKRTGPIKPSVTAGPLSDTTGQRSVFPQLVPAARDSEWQYDQDEETADGVEEEYPEDVAMDGWEDLLEEGMQDEEYEYDEGEVEEEEEEKEGEDEDWDVEPQTEAIAYLFSVRNEAEGLPALTYVPANTVTDPNTANGIPAATPSKPSKPNPPSSERNPWEAQFLTYYTSLRESIATHTPPTLTQPELDDLLHINPSKRPTTSSEEDSLWRLKTLDPPSLTLLSMLDHQRIIHLLTHLRKKMSANVKPEQCMWLFFLLAALGDLGVLNGDEVDLLRRIGRKCLSVRGGLEGEGEVVRGTIDMVVCVIREFYGQRDVEEDTF